MCNALRTEGRLSKLTRQGERINPWGTLKRSDCIAVSTPLLPKFNLISPELFMFFVTSFFTFKYRKEQLYIIRLFCFRNPMHLGKNSDKVALADFCLLGRLLKEKIFLRSRHRVRIIQFAK